TALATSRSHARSTSGCSGPSCPIRLPFDAHVGRAAWMKMRALVLLGRDDGRTPRDPLDEFERHALRVVHVIRLGLGEVVAPRPGEHAGESDALERKAFRIGAGREGRAD